jgi:hypothetical protein
MAAMAEKKSKKDRAPPKVPQGRLPRAPKLKERPAQKGRVHRAKSRS